MLAKISLQTGAKAREERAVKESQKVRKNKRNHRMGAREKMTASVASANASKMPFIHVRVIKPSSD